MADSSLDPDNLTSGRDRQLGRGHGTAALGPSDTSDSGSDLMGSSGLARDEVIPLDGGTTSDPEAGMAHMTDGPDVGDADLDGDSDSAGTGERATAGRDSSVRAGADIDVDRIEQVRLEDLLDAETPEDDDPDAARLTADQSDDVEVQRKREVPLDDLDERRPDGRNQTRH